MPTTGIENGTLTTIYVGSTAVSYSTNATLDLQMDEREITNKQTTGNAREFKPTRYSGTLSGDFNKAEDATEGFEELFDDLIAGTEATIKPSSSVTGDVEYSFTGFVQSLSITYPDADNATYSATWRIGGAVSKATI